MADDALTDLHEGMLDSVALARLFDAVAAQAQVESVTLKGGQEQYAGPEQVSLDLAHAALASGRVHGVQLRYTWADRAWCDTLLRKPGGVRLVRIEVTAPPA